MKTLDQIGLEHGTDKASNFHDYLNRYEPLFAPLRAKAIRLLELGVLGGASLLTWGEYFLGSFIIGMDIDEKQELGRELRERGLQICRGDCTTDEGWNALEYELRYETMHDKFAFDVIIDDASHNVYAIVKAFQLGFKYLKPGGLWIVEDTHYGYTMDGRRDNHLLGIKEGHTSTDYFAELVNNLNNHGLGQCGKPDPSFPIASITFSRSLIIIRKA